MIIIMKITKDKIVFFWLGGMLAAVILIWSAVLAKAQVRFLEVYFFDIGQGKAIFIETPNGNQILIDGGPNEKVLSCLSKNMPFFKFKNPDYIF